MIENTKSTHYTRTQRLCCVGKHMLNSPIKIDNLFISAPILTWKFVRHSMNEWLE